MNLYQDYHRDRKKLVATRALRRSAEPGAVSAER
jgi:hypothetical protein